MRDNLFPYTANKEQKNVVAENMMKLYNEKQVNKYYNGLEFERYTVILKSGIVKKYQGKKYVELAIKRFGNEIKEIKLGW